MGSFYRLGTAEIVQEKLALIHNRVQEDCYFKNNKSNPSF
jgi:hypothetical protein